MNIYRCSVGERFVGFSVLPPCDTILLSVHWQIELDITVTCPCCGTVRQIVNGSGMAVRA